MFRVNLLRLFEIGNGLVEPTDLPVHDALVGQDISIGRIEFKCLCISIYSFLGLIGIKIIIPQLNPCLSIFRISSNNFFCFYYPLLIVSGSPGSLGSPLTTGGVSFFVLTLKMRNPPRRPIISAAAIPRILSFFIRRTSLSFYLTGGLLPQ